MSLLQALLVLAILNSVVLSSVFKWYKLCGDLGSLTQMEVLKSFSQMLILVISLCPPKLSVKFQNVFLNQIPSPTGLFSRDLSVF